MKSVVEAFHHELSRLHKKMDWADYKLSTLELRVTYSKDKSTFVIEAYADHQTIKGTDLGRVMDEVYRRLGYEHQAAGAIEASMLALTGPDRD